jgi:hypothetical protein
MSTDVFCVVNSSKKNSNSYESRLALVEDHPSCGWSGSSGSGSGSPSIGGRVGLTKGTWQSQFLTCAV